MPSARQGAQQCLAGDDASSNNAPPRDSGRTIRLATLAGMFITHLAASPENTSALTLCFKAHLPRATFWLRFLVCAAAVLDTFLFAALHPLWAGLTLSCLRHRGPGPFYQRLYLAEGHEHWLQNIASRCSTLCAAGWTPRRREGGWRPAPVTFPSYTHAVHTAARAPLLHSIKIYPLHFPFPPHCISHMHF